jgi:hypothetical protein
MGLALSSNVVSAFEGDVVMQTYTVGFLVGSLARGSINRQLDKRGSKKRRCSCRASYARGAMQCAEQIDERRSSEPSR